MVGWKSDGRGSLQNVFHHDLKDPLVQMVFRAVPEPLGAFDLRYSEAILSCLFGDG